MDSTKPEYRNVIARGPRHGISLENGTLLIPVWMVPKSVGATEMSHYPAEVSTLYSTDNGETWQIGEILSVTDTVGDPNETVAVELSRWKSHVECPYWWKRKWLSGSGI